MKRTAEEARQAAQEVIDRAARLWLQLEAAHRLLEEALRLGGVHQLDPDVIAARAELARCVKALGAQLGEEGGDEGEA